LDVPDLGVCLGEERAMSENPNPVVCGNCHAMNPPGQEFCIRCHTPLTATAAAVALDQTPEAVDEPRAYAAEQDEAGPDQVVMGSLGGAVIPMPTEPLEPRPDDE
jgi:ribosomal protein L40E